ncbi:3D domain-containing protein [Neobacillus sp. D3-1R]|uniref:3D domain-containing protein n=1 Tax=Neobacillus sp. D3-1R TaxID=3445778 RepID=UPI003F9F7D1E
MLKTIKSLIAVAVLSGTVSANVQAATITVKKGDTLWSLSQVHNTSVENFQKLNQLNTDLIHPGDILLTSSKKQTKASTKATPQVTNKSTAKAKSPIVKAKKDKPTTAKTPAPKKTKQKKITVTATAYTASCKGCSGITKTGINIKANPHKKVIAVDPKVIPLGSKVYVEGYGPAIAGDIGGAIKGKRIDIFIPSKKAAIRFGVKKLNVTILN